MNERIKNFSIFTAHILSQLTDSFPIPIMLDRHSAMESVFDFDELYQHQTKLSNARFMREIMADLVASGSEHLTDEHKEKIRKSLEDSSGNSKIDSLQEKINELEDSVKELEQILNGSIAFLEAEKYIREVTGGWQLTEKGFSHLNKRFSKSDIVDSSETIISKIKEQLTNPSKLGGQMLTQLMVSGLGQVAFT